MKIWHSNVRRLARIAGVLLRHGLGHAVGERASSRPWLRRRLPMAGLPGPRRLRMLFEDLGGTFLKFGQMLALQPDILSLRYCDALFDLLDRVEPFPYADVERIVAEELGAGPDEIFDAFERRPLATASVGQVHVAWLGEQKVAVKVQRPTVEVEFGSDIRLMVGFMNLVRWLRLRPLQWLIEPMSEFVAWTEEELDYRYEARYSEELRSHPLDPIAQHVPRVFGELTTRRTLVVEFLEGVTLLEYLRARGEGDEILPRRLEGLGFDRTRFAAHVIDNFLGNAFRFGIYHADLHPANLMILRDSVVGYVDFGITGVLSRYARRHLLKMTLALAQGDMELLCDEFMRLTVYGPGSDLEGFRTGLDRLAEGWYEDAAGSRRLKASFTQIMTEMLHLSRATDVMPERDIVKYIRSSIAIDGLITRFEPDFDLGSYLVESCSRAVRWSTRRHRFTAARLLDASSAGGHLLQDGPQRGLEILDRLSAGELPVRVEPSTGAIAGEGELRRRALRFAGAAFGGAVLLVASPQPAGLGVNLWTAELTFVGAALVLLAGTLRRLNFA